MRNQVKLETELSARPLGSMRHGELFRLPDDSLNSSIILMATDILVTGENGGPTYFVSLGSGLAYSRPKSTMVVPLRQGDVVKVVVK